MIFFEIVLDFDIKLDYIIDMLAKDDYSINIRRYKNGNQNLFQSCVFELQTLH